MKPKIDIIYNMTAICPHDCPLCCVDAAHVTRRGNDVIIRIDGLATEHRIPRGPSSESIYDTASTALQKLDRELTLNQKLNILSNIDTDDVRLDISGGDPLVVRDNIEILKAASKKLGSDNITLTATGSGLAGINLVELAPLVSEFNFTYDGASTYDVADRPSAYAAANLAVGRKLAALGANTRAEFPITRATNDPDHIRRLYKNLHEAGIKKLLLMRLFPSGRGATVEAKTLTRGEYVAAIQQLRSLEREFGTPAVKLQCALRHIEYGEVGVPTNALNPCDMVRESFGLTPLGLLLASPWAINATGSPSHPEFVLGSLLETPLSEILASEKLRRFREHANANFGHCKVIAERFSKLPTAFERMHDKADPLYATATQAAVATE
jgi:MoaA/NifB/PqqE/SkfB family radical SAM enzyme